MREKSEKLLLHKIFFTLGILLLYLIGRMIPLYGIDISAYEMYEMDAETMLVRTVGGDPQQYSLLILGIAPYMLASMGVQMCMALKRGNQKNKTSRIKMNRIVIEAFILFCIIEAHILVKNMHFYDVAGLHSIYRGIAILEMITGACFILVLSEQNKKYGIGGQTTLIFVNILDNLLHIIKQHEWNVLKLPMALGVVMLFFIIVLETTEKRIPLQRISIQSCYSDKNYLAIKLNPIGIMPIMFATAFFLLPQFVLEILCNLFPQKEMLHFLQENMSLAHPIGIVIYIFGIYFLTFFFSLLLINPKDVAEQFLKSGDSLENIHPGKDTQKYLFGVVGRMAFFSSSIMALFLGIPLALQMEGEMESSLMMLPSTMMMLAGILCTIYQELVAVKHIDDCKPFL